jgi:hypothetical protein
VKLNIHGLEYDVVASDDKKSITINGTEHVFTTPQTNIGETALEIIKTDKRHRGFHHMSDYDQKHTKMIYIRDLKGFPRYEDGAAYGYGFVHKYEGDTTGCSQIMSGMTQKLAKQITGELNVAMEHGYSWAKHVIKHCRKEFDFEKCLREYKIL